MKLFIQNGTTFNKIEVPQNESVIDFKKRLPVTVESIRVYARNRFNVQLMEPGKTLSDYSVLNGDVISIHQKCAFIEIAKYTPQSFQIFIKTIETGKTITIEAERDDLILDLQEKFIDKEGYCCFKTGEEDRFAFVFAGRQMENAEEHPLRAWGIEKESTLHLRHIVVLRGGGIAFNFNQLDPNQTKQIRAVVGGPFFRQVIKGLNLSGKCLQEGCQARNQTVYIKLGIGSFNIGREKNRANCPACHQKIRNIVNLGFWDCTYTIEGHNEAVGEVKRTAKTPLDGHLTTFKEELQTQWKYLQITTRA